MIVETRPSERETEKHTRDSDIAHPEKVSERARAERFSERDPEKAERHERSTERGIPNVVPADRSDRDKGSEKAPESRDRREEQASGKEEIRRGAKEKERTPVEASPRTLSPPKSPETAATTTVGESTAAKPTTPPGSPREEVWQRVVIKV